MYYYQMEISCHDVKIPVFTIFYYMFLEQKFLTSVVISMELNEK